MHTCGENDSRVTVGLFLEQKNPWSEVCNRVCVRVRMHVGPTLTADSLCIPLPQPLNRAL